MVEATRARLDVIVHVCAEYILTSIPRCVPQRTEPIIVVVSTNVKRLMNQLFVRELAIESAVPAPLPAD